MRITSLLFLIFILTPFTIDAARDMDRQDRFGNQEGRQDEGMRLGQREGSPGFENGNRGEGRRTPPTVPEWPVGTMYGSAAAALGIGYYLISRKKKNHKA